MSGLAVQLRPEWPADDDAIERLHERAFGPGRFARTAFRLRERNPVIPELCWIAHVGTLLVASVRVAGVTAGTEPALVLGPLAVEPAFEKRGIGGALMRRSLDAARQGGHGLVLLIGDLPYYQRFGFAVVPRAQLELPSPVDPARFLVAELRPGALSAARGRVVRGIRQAPEHGASA